MENNTIKNIEQSQQDWFHNKTNNPPQTCLSQKRVIIWQTDSVTRGSCFAAKWQVSEEETMKENMFRGDDWSFWHLDSLDNYSYSIIIIHLDSLYSVFAILSTNQPTNQPKIAKNNKQHLIKHMHLINWCSKIRTVQRDAIVEMYR